MRDEYIPACARSFDDRVVGGITKSELTDVHCNYARRCKSADERGRQVGIEQERLRHGSRDLEDLVAGGPRGVGERLPDVLLFKLGPLR